MSFSGSATVSAIYDNPVTGAAAKIAIDSTLITSDDITATIFTLTATDTDCHRDHHQDLYLH